jgi:hypothetical protein
MASLNASRVANGGLMPYDGKASSMYISTSE